MSHLKKVSAEDSAAEKQIDSGSSAVNAGMTRQVVPVVTNQNQETWQAMNAPNNHQQAAPRRRQQVTYSPEKSSDYGFWKSKCYLCGRSITPETGIIAG